MPAKVCGCCGCQYTAEAWALLAVVGGLPWGEDMGAAPGTMLDVRLCSRCDSSIAIEVKLPEALQPGLPSHG